MNKEKLIDLSKDAWVFVKETAHDFASVWKTYPNVLIWSGIAFLIACFV